MSGGRKPKAYRLSTHRRPEAPRCRRELQDRSLSQGRYITPSFRSSQRSAPRSERLRLSLENLIDGASSGPEALKAIGEAFAEISNNFGDEPADVEKARFRLAKAILSIANADSRDNRAALQRMALD